MAVERWGKKAFFFTVIALLLSMTLIMGVVLRSEHRIRNNQFSVEFRIKSINSFLTDLEKDLGRGLFIAGFRSLLSMEQWIASNGVYIDDAEKRFYEAFLNGTVNQTEIEIMTNNTFPEWVERIQKEGENIDTRLNITLNGVKLAHDTPWSVLINVNVTIELDDLNGLARWNKTQIMNTTVSIIEFEDPLYTLNSFGRILNRIKRTNVSNFVYEDDPENLTEHIKNQFYIESQLAPSFLMRLEGNLSNSTMGIESLVYVPDFSVQEIYYLYMYGNSINDTSCVDYVFFGNLSEDNTGPLYKITGAYDTWFLMDNISNRLHNYDATNIAVEET